MLHHSKPTVWLCLCACLLVGCTAADQAGSSVDTPSVDDRASPSTNQEPPPLVGQIPPSSFNGQVPLSSDQKLPPPNAKLKASASSDEGHKNSAAPNSQTLPSHNQNSASSIDRNQPANSVAKKPAGDKHPAADEQRRPTSGRMPPRPPPPPPGRGQRPPPPPPPPSPKRPPGGGRFPSFLVPSSEPNSFESSASAFVYVLPSRSRQCFHHRSAKPFLVEFRVLHGGRLDVDAYIVGPDGLIVYESRERRHGSYAVTVKAAPAGANNEAGAADASGAQPPPPPLYTICLDNRYASWYAKVIDFSIQLARQPRGGEPAADAAAAASKTAAGSLSEELATELERLDLSWAQFMEMTDTVEDNLHNSARLQRQLRGDEAADRMAMEDSADRVTQWSLVQVGIMACVSTLQVLMIRALFDEKSLLHRVWKFRGTFLVKS